MHFFFIDKPIATSLLWSSNCDSITVSNSCFDFCGFIFSESGGKCIPHVNSEQRYPYPNITAHLMFGHIVHLPTYKLDSHTITVSDEVLIGKFFWKVVPAWSVTHLYNYPYFCFLFYLVFITTSCLFLLVILTVTLLYFHSIT